MNPLLDGYRILKTTLKLAVRYSPTFVMFVLGALLIIPGSILGGYVAYFYLFEGVKYYVKGLIAVILLIAGYHSLLLAILTLYLKRMEYRIIRLLRMSKK